MIDIIEKEFEKFKEDYKRGLIMTETNDYLIPIRHEDDYSWDTISSAQNKLCKSIESYLKDKGDIDYRVFHDWRVCVIHHDLEKLIKKEEGRDEESEPNLLEIEVCDYCNSNSLEGINQNLAGDRTMNRDKLKVELTNDKMIVEVVVGDTTISNSININYCPICRRELG